MLKIKVPGMKEQDETTQEMLPRNFKSSFPSPAWILPVSSVKGSKMKKASALKSLILLPSLLLKRLNKAKAREAALRSRVKLHEHHKKLWKRCLKRKHELI